MATCYSIRLANNSATQPGTLIAKAYIYNDSVTLSFEKEQDSYFQEQPGEIDKLKSAVLNGADIFTMKGWPGKDGILHNAWSFTISLDKEPPKKCAGNE